MSKLKMLILDVDGTLTDGKIYMGPNGEVFKAFNAHDGQGIRKLKKAGIETIIITGRESRIVENRAKEIDITEIYQGVSNKKEKLLELIKDKKISLENVGYIGDDENDLEAMQLCGFKACPNDAVERIKSIADYISPKPCNESAVREIIENVILKTEVIK